MRVASLLLLLFGCRRLPPGADSAGGGDDTSAADSGDTGTGALPDPPVALVADGGNERFLWIRLDTGDVLHELDLPSSFPEQCVEGYDCVAFGSDPILRDDEDGAIIVAAVSTLEGSAPEKPAFVASIRLSETGPQVDWLLDSLDFTANFAGRDDICAQVTPCRAPDPDVYGNEAWRACTFQTTHAVSVVEEDEGGVTLWIGDTGKPPRALEVRLDRGSTCGVVEEVIGPPTTDDWTDESGPNDLDTVDFGGETRLLLDHLSTSGDEVHGRITHWREGTDGWELVWRHPADGSKLMGGHEADLVPEDDGTWTLVYAHGNGAGAHGALEDWTGTEDHRGSVGFARVEGDGPPEYLFDVVVSGESEFGFLRDADRLPDGTFMVVDSGCFNHTFEDCDRQPAIWHVAVDGLAEAEPAGRSGAFSEDHGEQRFVEARLVEDGFGPRLPCGLRTPYEADLLPELGAFLRGRLDAPEGTCAQEEEAAR